MAQYIGLGSEEPIEDSEKIVANSLKRLSDEWVVLHHVSWQSERRGKQGDGEADFVVIHPQLGMLVIEVKGGGIDVQKGRWFTTNRHGSRHQIKNPYEQAIASKHALVGWLKDRNFDQKLRLGHAVAFPHMQSLPVIGPAAVPEISFTRQNLDDIASSIEACFKHWALAASLSELEVNKLVSLLAPTFSIPPNLSGQSSDAESKMLMFTAEQIEVFAGLRANRGGLILGRAGTGKTILAVARAQQLARDGFRTLLVCYNELLGDDLFSRTNSPPKITSCTFHNLTIREAQKAKLHIPNVKTNEWWEESAPTLLVQACKVNNTNFDAIVIDEGQDFSSLWLESLRELLINPGDAPYFVFADSLQDIWKRDWAASNFPFVWELTRNLRNTQQIAERVAASIDVIYKKDGISGPVPYWQVTEGDPTERDVLEAVENLIEEGFGPVSLVILCGSANLVRHLRERTVGPYSLGPWKSNGITVETVARFKGLEAQAVIFALHGIKSEQDITQAYIAISRARSVLRIVGASDNKKKINWPM